MVEKRCVAQALQPQVLAAKEGLALLNGTQAMNALGLLALERARRLVRLADVAGAMSLEALKGTPAAFDERIHRGAAPCRANRRCRAPDRIARRAAEIRESHREHDSRVQDAYCLRCMPQVHGAVRDVLDHVAAILEIESGSATDNPLIFPEPSSKESEGGARCRGGIFMARRWPMPSITRPLPSPIWRESRSGASIAC